MFRKAILKKAFLKQIFSQKLNHKIVLQIIIGGSALYISNFIKNVQLVEKNQSINILKLDMNSSSIQNNQVEIVNHDNHEILLTRIDNKLYSCYGRCPKNCILNHDGLIKDKVYCIEHGYQFSILTGEAEYSDSIQSIETYQVNENNSGISILLPSVLRKYFINYKKVLGIDFNNTVLVGNDLSVIGCAYALRKSGYFGKIYHIQQDSELPFNLQNALQLNLQTEVDSNMLKELDVQSIDANIEYINIDKNLIEFNNNKNPLSYDFMLLANKEKQIVNNIRGVGQSNVYFLDEFKQIHEFKSKLESAQSVVVMGQNHNAMTLMSAISNLNQNIKITNVGLQQKPFQSEYGEVIATIFETEGQKMKIQFIQSNEIQQIDQQVVQLKNNLKINSDLVVVLNDSFPDQKIVRHGLRISPGGGLYTDCFLRTSNESIFAAGNLANFPYFISGQRQVIKNNKYEQINQGFIAAANILEKRIPYTSIPFNTFQFGSLRFNTIGIIDDYDNIIYDGEIQNNDFMAYYLKNNKLIGAATFNRFKDLIILREVMNLQKTPIIQDLVTNKQSTYDRIFQIIQKYSQNSHQMDIFNKKPVTIR